MQNDVEQLITDVEKLINAVDFIDKDKGNNLLNIENLRLSVKRSRIL